MQDVTYTYLTMNIIIQNWSNYNNLEHYLISIRIKSVSNFLMWASVQQNSISKRMQVTKRCYEGKVGQQSVQLEQINHWIVLNVVFWNPIPRHHL